MVGTESIFNGKSHQVSADESPTDCAGGSVIAFPYRMHAHMWDGLHCAFHTESLVAELKTKETLIIIKGVPHII